ncbi:MAG: phasin family protein [Alphaproteobacteria bacterium]|nr:phasin family protein [Alphaproteobacteria bacterium]
MSKRKTKKPAAKKSAAKKRASAPLKSATAKQATSQDWTQQSAKLYQLPFAQGDMNKAAKDMQSMTEQAVKASTDLMQQFFGGAKGFDTSKLLSQFDPSKAFAQFDASKAFGQFDPSKMFSQFADAAKGSEKAFSFGKDASAHLQKSAQGATKAVNEAVELSRENAEAAMQCGNIAVSVSKNISAEIINYANKAFAQNVELSKQIFNCRTLNDMFDLSSKFFKSNLDGLFNESLKVSELAFSGASEISEPLNERVAESTERFVKAVAA